MKHLFICLLPLISCFALAQEIDWEPLELGHKEIVARNIKWMAFSTDRHREEGTGEYFQYDENGYASLVADTHAIGGTYHRYETTLDEKGRLKKEVIFKEKVLKKGVETFKYNADGLIQHNHKLHLGYGMAEIMTNYEYRGKALMKQESTVDGKPLTSVNYFNNNKGLADSSLEFSMRRGEAELIHKTYFKWFKNRRKAGEWKLTSAGDTMEIRLYNSNGHLLYEKTPIINCYGQNDEQIFESKQYVYKKGVLREEIWKNDMYVADNGGPWEHKVHYSKKGIRLDDQGGLMTNETSTSKQGEWLVEHTMFKDDTIKTVKTRNTTAGKEERVRKMSGLKRMNMIPAQVNLYNKHGQLIKTWMEEYYLEEKCTSTYVYTQNLVVETKICARTGYDRGAESMERITYSKNQGGLTKRKTLETKNYETDDTLRLLEETLFWYTKDGERDSMVYQRFWEGDTIGNTYRYQYNPNGKIERILYYNLKGNTNLVVKTDSFYYDKTGELKRKTITSTQGSQGSIPVETRFYDKNGRLTKVLFGNERGDDRTEIKVT